jgi:predicted nucleotidyltransferase
MNVNPDYLDELRRILEETVPSRIVVSGFGSRVKDGHKEGADIDIVIQRTDGKAVDFDAMLRLKDRITESTIPVFVDLFDWYRLPASMQKRVEAERELLFIVDGAKKALEKSV